MGAYLVKFTPLEPYFFGNERNFGYGLAKNKTYFIESNEWLIQFIWNVWSNIEHMNVLQRNPFSILRQKAIVL